jgi:hypothetical protein
MAQSAQINAWTSEESLFDSQEKHEIILHFKASRPPLDHSVHYPMDTWGLFPRE